jgi:uncharacterized protein (TIGR04255 family)
MTASSYIEPIKGKHSIAEAICIIVLVNPLIDLQRFKALVSAGELVGEFQSFRLKPTRNFSVSLDATLMPHATVTEPQDTGFLLESFNGGDLDWLLSYDANPPMPTISLHNYNYSGWQDFKAKTVKVLQALATLDTSMYINTTWLTYKDQFIWASDQPIDLSKHLFKQNRFIPDALRNDVNDWQLALSHVIKHESGTILAEQVSAALVSGSESKKAITIQHNVGYPSGNPTPMDKSGIELLSEQLETVHNYNKEFLRQCLHADILTRIGISTTN